MREFIMLTFLALTISFSSCEKEVSPQEETFEFVQELSAAVTVGGIVGIINRNFEIGERYIGTLKNNGIVIIRIAEHLPINDNSPCNACYQEFLEVPSEFLQLVK